MREACATAVCMLVASGCSQLLDRQDDDYRCAADPGTVMAVGAAVATAVAILAIGAIPKSEPALVVAMWFHGSSLLTAAIALTVGDPGRVMTILG